MNFVDRLNAAEKRSGSMLCVGLDPEPAKFPGTWRNDSAYIHDFCARIVDATKDLVIAFKPQIAHFAAHRAEDQLERLIAHIRRVAPDVPVILDAKRGDIGSTAEQYAREAFERYQADAVTLSPFMGFDSIEPYLRWPKIKKKPCIICAGRGRWRRRNTPTRRRLNTSAGRWFWCLRKIWKLASTYCWHAKRCWICRPNGRHSARIWRSWKLWRKN